MARTSDKHGEHATHTKARTKLPMSNHQVTSSVTLLKRPVPHESVEKATKIFKNFSLSKFTESGGGRRAKSAKKPLPANYVGEWRDPAAVHAVQRKLISKKIQTLNNSDASSQGMTFALPPKQIKSLLPSYSEKAGTVQLSDVLSLLTTKMKGTEFYSKGNPTLNRLSMQAQVDQIMQAVKQEPKK